MKSGENHDKILHKLSTSDHVFYGKMIEASGRKICGKPASGLTDRRYREPADLKNIRVSGWRLTLCRNCKEMRIFYEKMIVC